MRDTENQDTTWIRLTCVWFYNCQADQIVMSSSNLMPVVTRPQTIDEVPSHLSESFLRHGSDSHLDKLYDLPEDIQDVMGLQALRPSAAVCKVMTIPNSNCVRVVTPDEHVNTGFHEILVYDMGQEEWPQVPLCDIGCLAFVGCYQLELEQREKRAGIASDGRQLVRALRVTSTFRLISVNTWLCIISIWHSYGAARSHGVRFGKGHHKIVWTTCAGHTTHHSR